MTEPDFLLFASDAELAAYWGAACLFAAVVCLGMERRRMRRTEINRVGWMPWTGLFLAGDWTQTGWPSTMEGAVRSGLMAAEALLAQQGATTRLRPHDLPAGRLARWLLRIGTETARNQPSS